LKPGAYKLWVNCIQLVQPHPAPEDVRLARAAARVVAVQVAIGKQQSLKPVFHLIGPMVETRRFQAVGQLDSVAFESKGLKPGFHLIGPMVETRRFQAMDGSTGFSLYSPTEMPASVNSSCVSWCRSVASGTSCVFQQTFDETGFSHFRCKSLEQTRRLGLERTRRFQAMGPAAFNIW
jgi:hypothetical protein